MDDMTPPAIIQTARDEGLHVIAICDHNTAGNAAAVQEAAGDALSVIAGMEVTTAEEAHVLGLFPNAQAACDAAAEVADTLPDATEASTARFGDQPLMDADGCRIGTEKRMLSAASQLTLSDVSVLIQGHGGLVIASHVDRPSFSVTSQLGMFPSEVHFDAIEVSCAGIRRGRQHEFAYLGLPMVGTSDSHMLSDVGGCTTMLDMASLEFGELVLAFRGSAGRSCAIA
jgi:PHP-associated